MRNLFRIRAFRFPNQPDTLLDEHESGYGYFEAREFEFIGIRPFSDTCLTPISPSTFPGVGHFGGLSNFPGSESTRTLAISVSPTPVSRDLAISDISRTCQDLNFGHFGIPTTLIPRDLAISGTLEISEPYILGDHYNPFFPGFGHFR